MAQTDIPQYDAIIIGAGVSGLYSLHRLRERGMTARVFEAGDAIGGTWYWNRYPGARLDSESWSYQYSFSKDLIDGWNWTEHFASQPEIERYLNYVVDKLELRDGIELETRVKSCVYDDATRLWTITTDAGRQARARYVIAATGFLSAHQFPEYPGVEEFKGLSLHTARWPKEGVDLKGKRVGIIGTGPTAVQVIQTIVYEVKHLTVFQRTPNWCTALRNRPMDEATRAGFKRDAQKIFDQCNETLAAFIHKADPRNGVDIPKAERWKLYEELHARGGFALWFANYHDVFTSKEIADDVGEFLATKIRERVKDPVMAEKLIPKDHTFGTKRPPGETNYYEAYNNGNIDLVELKKTPIERITPTGVRTSERDYEFDIIIYATGFRSLTGELMRIDIRGREGLSLAEKWSDGPKTNLGVQFAGFPNLFAILGPHNPATFCNLPRCIENNVDWVMHCIDYLKAHGQTSIETTVEAENAWTQVCNESAQGLLIGEMKDSWFYGNNNQGGERGHFLLYAGGVPAYRQIFREVEAQGYPGFVRS